MIPAVQSAAQEDTKSADTEAVAEASQMICGQTKQWTYNTVAGNTGKKNRVCPRMMQKFPLSFLFFSMEACSGSKVVLPTLHNRAWCKGQTFRHHLETFLARMGLGAVKVKVERTKKWSHWESQAGIKHWESQWLEEIAVLCLAERAATEERSKTSLVLRAVSKHKFTKAGRNCFSDMSINRKAKLWF